MPLIVISGLPCSGKSTVAATLADLCRQLGQEVQIVDEDSLHLQRNDSYKDAASEKVARGALMSAIDRALTRKRTVVFDSHNNIKGYRYQLYCIARAAATRYCVVHVDTPPDTCREWNRQRGAGAGFTEAIFEDLAGRFERPDSRNRWDAPLFTARTALGQVAVREELEAAASAVGDDPRQQQQQAAAAGAVQQQQQHQQQQQEGQQGQHVGGIEEEPGGYEDRPQLPRVAKQLKPHVATDTTSARLAATNLQHDIDRALQQVVQCVADAQAAAGSGAPGVVTFPAPAGCGGDSTLPELDMYRPMFLPELRRHKRAAMRLATSQTFSRMRDAAAAQRLFIAYLRDQLAQA